MIQTVLALTTEVAVDCRVSALSACVSDLLSTYPAAARAQLSYQMESTTGGYRLCRDGETIYTDAEALALVPALELDLHRQVSRAAGGFWVLHAACVERDGRAVVLTGPSGAGKTTAVRAALAAGWRYVSEEMVAIGIDGAVRGLRRPLHVETPDPDTRPYLIPTPAGIARRHLWHPPCHQLADGSRVSAIVSWRYRPDRGSGCRRLSPGHTLARAWPQTLGTLPRSLATAEAVVARFPGYEAHVAATGDVVPTLENVIRRAEPPAFEVP